MKKRYHITKRPDGNWQGKAENGQRASTVGGTQLEVINQMAEIGNNNGNAQVFIHRGDNGQIRDESTYGYDPRDIKG